MRMPILLLLVIKCFEHMLGDYIFDADESCVGFVRVVNDALTLFNWLWQFTFILDVAY
jgi:hypothetical protein